MYRDAYTITQLNTSDDGVVYECRMAIQGVRAHDTVRLNVTGGYFNYVNRYAQ